MRRSLLVVVLFCFAVQLSDAQLWKMRRWEAQAGGGLSFSFPDVGGFTQGKNLLGLKDLSYRQTRFDVSGTVRYRLSRTANARVSLTYAMLHSTDRRGSNEGRQFESLTHLFEPSMIFEYYFVKNKYENSYLFLRGKSLWSLLSSLDIYAFAGVGGAAYSVNANDLLTLQAQKSSGFTGVIPGGIGATLVYTPNLNFGVELGGRYTLTDYIDGYHSEQFSKANDVYYLLNFTVTYKLKTSAKGWPSFR
jgi:hypothetical protein